MTPEAARNRYEGAWRSFAKDLNQLQKELSAAVAEGKVPSLHELLQSLAWVPYVEAKKLFNARDKTSGNIGSVTGLFFELMVCSIVAPFLARELPGVEVAYNRRVGGIDPSLPRDPDISVRFGGRTAVIEIKVSPKKRSLEEALERRKTHLEHGTAYYLVGGGVSANRELLTAFAAPAWACFMTAPDSNVELLKGLPKLDAVLQNAVEYLRARG